MFNRRQRPNKYTKIVTASLGGDAGVIGAALLAAKEWSNKNSTETLITTGAH